MVAGLNSRRCVAASPRRNALTPTTPTAPPSTVQSFNWLSEAGDRQPIRIVTIGGEPWFVARDVCKALGMDMTSGTHKWTRYLQATEKGNAQIPTLGGPQNMVTIAEAGFYKLVMRSDKPQARQFQDWVTRHVLPAIRKTGSYVAGEERLSDPLATSSDLEALSDHIITLLQRKAALVEERLARALQERDAAERAAAVLAGEKAVLEPKAAIVDAVFRLREAAASRVQGCSSCRLASSAWTSVQTSPITRLNASWQRGAKVRGDAGARRIARLI